MSLLFELPSLSTCMRGRAKHLALVFGIILLPLTTLAAVAQGQDGADAPPPAVEVRTIKVEPVSDPVTFSGTVEAIDEVNIMARVQGFLEDTTFEAGQNVDKGAVLFEIESAPYDASVSSAEAKLAQAQARYKNASSELERQSVLVERSVTAQAKLDQVKSEAEVAEADVKAAEAGVESARIDQGYTTIHAPFAGEISRSFFSNGALVGPQAGPLARLVRLDPMRVVFSIPDSFLVDMRLDEQNGGGVDPDSLDFTVRLPGGKAYSGKGKVEYIASETDSGTGTVPVRLTFENPDKVLIPGQFVSVMIAESDAPEMPVVPQTAILQDRQGRYVFVLGEDDTVSQRRIEVGPKVEGGRGVTDGLEGGEQVVVAGVQKIGDGAKVQAVDASARDEGGDGSETDEADAAQSADQN